MNKIYFTERHFDELTPCILQQAGHEVYVPKEEIENVHTFGRPELIATLKEIQPDVLVVGLKFQIDKEILDSAPIKAVFTRTTALDLLDLDYCRRKNVDVISLRNSNLSGVTAVSEWVVGNLICLLRNGNPGYQIKDKIIGLIGYGRISKHVERIVTVIGAKVIYCDPLNPESVPLEILLKESDIVS